MDFESIEGLSDDNILELYENSNIEELYKAECRCAYAHNEPGRHYIIGFGAHGWGFGHWCNDSSYSKQCGYCYDLSIHYPNEEACKSWCSYLRFNWSFYNTTCT